MTHAAIRIVMFLIPSGFLLFLGSHRLRFLNIAALVKERNLTNSAGAFFTI